MTNRNARLSHFPQNIVETETQTILSAGDISASTTPWPALDGCVTVVFASRAGSTFLCRYAETQFMVNNVGENLNAGRLSWNQGQRSTTNTLDTLKEMIRETSEAGWFMCKAGAPGIVSGELHGFFDQYLDRTHFVLLFRRDIVQQAISLFKANLTRHFHSFQQVEKPAQFDDYDRDEIATHVKTIHLVCVQLKSYVGSTGRPCNILYYEDFENGNMTTVNELLSSIGLPKRPAAIHHEGRSVEKLDRLVNQQWHKRFLAEMDGTIREITEEYTRLIGR
jgi:hypothetical protein